MKYVVWSWGDRKVSLGKVLEESADIMILEIEILGDIKHLVLPKGSFKFKYFNSKEEAEEYLEDNVR